MASFSASSVAAVQADAEQHQQSKEEAEEAADRLSPMSSARPPASTSSSTDGVSSSTAKLNINVLPPTSNGSPTSRPRTKSLQEKYHPVDAEGKRLHAKILDPTLANPHHSHLDLYHPSPVRTPSPSRIGSPKPGAPKPFGTTEKMKIDRYADGKRHILVGATGSVASVKIPLIVKSLLAHEMVEVQVIVTKTAKHFFDVDKLKTEFGIKVWEDEDDWKVSP
jgi:hypothetical protein